MAKIRFIVMGFASHKTWAEGYQKYALVAQQAVSAAAAAAATTTSQEETHDKDDAHDRHDQQQQNGSDHHQHPQHPQDHEGPHDVTVNVIPSDRWKYRMIVGCDLTYLVESPKVLDEMLYEDDIIILDGGMFDATTFVSTLLLALHNNTMERYYHSSSSSSSDNCYYDASSSSKNRNRRSRRRNYPRLPKIYCYYHENQLTTPFTKQDRDMYKNNTINKRNQNKNQETQTQTTTSTTTHTTHWHYGMIHYKSMFVVDGYIFNSQTHYNSFAQALPKLVKEQFFGGGTTSSSSDPTTAAGSGDATNSSSSNNNNTMMLEYQLSKITEFLETKCCILYYGLQLDELVISTTPSSSDDGVFTNDDTLSLLSRPAPPPRVENDENDFQQPHEGSNGNRNDNNNIYNPNSKSNLPVILWNARLEEDKDPNTFIELLRQVRNRLLLQQQETMAFSSSKEESSKDTTTTTTATTTTSNILFQLIVLGADVTKDQIYMKKLQTEFSKELLYVGWCTSRSMYSHWLSKSNTIVISSAKHETFGISIVESIYCGAIPLLPATSTRKTNHNDARLAYPEILQQHKNDTNQEQQQQQQQQHYYTSINDGVTKLINLMDLVSNDNRREEYATVRRTFQDITSKYRWSSVMGSVYDQFFTDLMNGDSIVLAGEKAQSIRAPSQMLTTHHQMDPKKQQQLREENVVMSEDDGNYLGQHDTHKATKRPRLQPQQQKTTPKTFTVRDVNDFRIQLYKPKSIRNNKEYNKQLTHLRSKYGIISIALHGGRRATTRMIEAITKYNANIKVVSFLTTQELADQVLTPVLSLDSPTQRQLRGKGDGQEVAEQSPIVPSPSAPLSDMQSCHLQVPIYVAHSKEVLDGIRGQKLNTGDAILSIIQFPISSTLDELIANPPILMLDNVRNSENVGSILRTAFCLGITSVVCSSGASWSTLRDSRAARCSMGTMYYHKYYESTSLETTIQLIKKKGADRIHVYGVEIGPTATPVEPHQPADGGEQNFRNYAIVMGNEDVGLLQAIRDACDSLVFIPQSSGDSLNVGHAAAIAMFELGRKRPMPQHDGRAACT